MKTFFSLLSTRLLPLLVRLRAESISFLTAAARSPYFFPGEVPGAESDLGNMGSLAVTVFSKLVLLVGGDASSDGR
jgi:hypothetical protein